MQLENESSEYTLTEAEKLTSLLSEILTDEILERIITCDNIAAFFGYTRMLAVVLRYERRQSVQQQESDDKGYGRAPRD